MSNEQTNFGYAAVIGAVSGLRSMMAPAIVSHAAHNKVLRLENTRLSWLAEDAAVYTMTLLALGELIADKLPFMPDRTEPPSLAWRVISGAACGYAVYNKKRSRWMAAVVGGTAALAMGYAGSRYRARVKFQPIAAALIEDAVAISSGAAVIAAIGN